MSQPGQRQYEVVTNAKFPFHPPKIREKRSKKGSKHKLGDPKKEEELKGPSGSHWNENHLNWLHILHEFDYDLKYIFSTKSQLSQSSKIATYLRARLKEEWTWVCQTDHKESSSIYSCLKDLVRVREEDDPYSTHSNTQSSTKHITPRSAKSDSVTPQQYARETQDSRGESQLTPTPLPRSKEATYQQTHTPQMLSRKRQLEEIVSPQRGRSGRENPLRYPETTPPFNQNRDGSPTPRQPSHQLRSPATPSRLMPPPDSPLTHGKHDLATHDREIQSHSEPDCLKPFLIEQPSFVRRKHLITPEYRENIRETHDGQQGPSQSQIETQGVDASATIQSQTTGLQPVTYDDEENGNEEEDGEEDLDADDSVSEEDIDAVTEAAAYDKTEDDVKATGRVFLSLVRDAINNTRQDVDPEKVAEQNLVFETRDPRPHDIRIDETPMSTHPDLVLVIVFGKKGQRKNVGVVLEFKRRKPRLTKEKLLAQEVSELLGAVLDKMAANGHRNTYTSYLISWHGLMGYISHFRASRDYLQQLQVQSRSLQDVEPPKVKRSKEFDLTKTEERIEFAIGCARIAVEELQEYERAQTSGLLDRILS